MSSLEHGHVHVFGKDECPFEWCLTLPSPSFPFVLFFCSSKIVGSLAFFSLFFSGGWRASGEPLLMDYIDERA